MSEDDGLDHVVRLNEEDVLRRGRGQVRAGGTFGAPWGAAPGPVFGRPAPDVVFRG